MRIPAEMTPGQLKEAHDAADTLASEKFRPYLPGRLLPLLVARFRDDVTEALGLPLPTLPQRAPVRDGKLDDLTSGELDDLSGAVLTLVTRFVRCMDDPELPKQLRDFRDALVIEKADRAKIAEELTAKVKAS
jgi:hypothetical protein